MTLTQLKKLIRETQPTQRRKLYEWLDELVRQDQGTSTSGTSASRKEKIEESVADGRTYRLESVRCGKKGCKCAEGKLHGPYWYAYWFENGKTKSQYVGKKLPRIE
jgi:hypothetical protein